MNKTDKPTYKETFEKQKMYVKIYGALCLFVILIAAGVFYFRGLEYLNFTKDLQKSKTLVEEQKKELTNETALYDTNKLNFNKLSAQIASDLTMIFPSRDQYSELTRKFDEFEEELNDPANNNPFEVSNLEYQEIKQMDTYSILPLRMTIKASSENFTKFLHLIESSGTLNSKIRLMDLSSIRLNFSKAGGDGSQEIINFTVQINAYFANNQ